MRARAGQTVDDHCRSCKTARRHTVIAALTDGTIVRVLCDTCSSQHNYRGGPRTESGPRVAGGAPARRGTDGGGPFPLVSENERSAPPMSDVTSAAGGADLEVLLRRIIREESGLTPATPADKWRGGRLVLVPGREGLQEKAWPVETFFHKIVMLRNRLRLLEQQVNSSDLPADVKAKIDGYVTACYGSLTSFNVLFADEDDRFRGSGG